MLYKFKDKSPIIDDESFIADDTSIIGDVVVEENASIWFGARLRGDIEKIFVGKGSNVQDNSTLHTDYDTPCILGNYVTIGHNVIVHGAVVEDNVIVGMHSTLLNGSVIPKNSIVAAGSLVTAKSKLEEGTLIMGAPAKSVRKLREEEIEKIRKNAEHYIEKVCEYKRDLKEVEDER